jgi:hypothetical protein
VCPIQQCLELVGSNLVPFLERMTFSWYYSSHKHQNCIIFNMMKEAIIWQKQKPTYWTIFFVMLKIYFIYKVAGKNPEFTIKPIYSCHCLDNRDTILALKASGVSNSTMSGASRFQSRTVLGKNDIFLVHQNCIIFNMMKEAIIWQKQKPTYWTIFFVMLKIYFIYKVAGKNPEGLYKI